MVGGREGGREEGREGRKSRTFVVREALGIPLHADSLKNSVRREGRREGGRDKVI